ncbi:CAZyme family GH43 [Aspergillus niger]|nr:CAZyme family GH43 [Aspergillus niger]
MGYDTSPFWDQNGDAYIVGSHAWQVYPAIQLAKVNLTTARVGNWSTLWTGTGGEAPEGPHLYYGDSMYYLMIAEGGTGDNHMETMAQSKTLLGPYESNPANPVLTAANTTRFCKFYKISASQITTHLCVPVQTIGHADLFQDALDNWWAVALATREDTTHDYHPMGRETVLTPVTWETGEWPVFSIVEGEMEGWARPPAGSIAGDGPWITDGYAMDFAPGSSLPLQLTHWRFPANASYEISPAEHPYTLKLNPSSANLTYDLNVNMDYMPTTVNEEAGVTSFLQQNKHVELGVVLLQANEPYLRVRGVSTVTLPSYQTALPAAWANTTLHLEIKALNWTHYALSIGPAASMSSMKTLAYPINSALGGGFTGTFVGVYATSNGGDGSTPAYFSNWTYLPQGQFIN